MNTTQRATEPQTTRTSPSTGTVTRRSSPLTDPAQVHDAFMAATNAHDVEALLALYDTDGVAVQLDGGEARGEAGMRVMFEGLTAAIARIDGTTRKLFVADGVALSSATWTADVVLPDGTHVLQHGTTAEVSVRQPDGAWKVLIDDPLFA